MMPKQKQEILIFAHNTLFFVVPNYKSFTFSEWAKFIKKVYSIDNPRTKEIVEFLEIEDGTIWNQHTLSQIKHANIKHTLKH